MTMSYQDDPQGPAGMADELQGDGGEMTDDDGLFLDGLADDDEEEAVAGDPWHVLVVDDEADVHNVSRVALQGVRFHDRPLNLIGCYSAAEALGVLQGRKDIALILLDVVMESDHAGLDLVRAIRRDLSNHYVRIVLRTGQPGAAPERQVIEDFDINDYKAKTELTRDKLYTAVIGGLRNYNDIVTIETQRRSIEANRRGLLRIIDASSTIFRDQSLTRFSQGVLESLQALLFGEDAEPPKDTGAFAVLNGIEQLVGLGRFKDLSGKPLAEAAKPEQLEAINSAVAQAHSVVAPGHYIGFVPSASGLKSVLYVECPDESVTADESLVELFCYNVGIALDNLQLRSEIEATQREIIYRLGEVVETRSKETGNHVRRVAEYSRVLALALGLDEEEAEIVRIASPLHDIGKVGIPDAILMKPGPLTDEEREIMKTHAETGFSMLRAAKSRALNAGALIAHEHHEKWDGSGYPRRLAGTDIHLYGRITALADVFDALGSDRVYKKAWELPRILDLIQEERGRHFDPDVVDKFLEHFEEIDRIRLTYKDL